MTNATPTVGFSEETVKNDPVNHPKHYTDHPSGVECIQITEHMGFNLGNAVKYIWRCDLKLDAIEDLKKAGCTGASVTVVNGKVTVMGEVPSAKYATCIQTIQQSGITGIDNQLKKGA